MPEYVNENSWQRRLKLAVGQIDVTVGDLEGNVRLILKAIDKAKQEKCNVIVFPEMCLTGGPAYGLLAKSDFIKSQIAALKSLASNVGEVVSIVGFVNRREDGLFNSAALMFNGKIIRVVDKVGTSNVDGFDEGAYFKPGELAPPLRINAVPMGILIGDDVLRPGLCERLVSLGASLIVAPTAHSFRVGTPGQRIAEVADRTRVANVDVMVVNLVGAFEQTVYHGGSFIVNLNEQLLWRAPLFTEGTFVAELAERGQREGADDGVESTRAAVCLSIRDYVRKSGFSKVLIGLSGGIDSAVVAAIAAEALGPDNVLGILMPSAVSSPDSEGDAKTLASNLGIQTKTIPIRPLFDAYLQSLGDEIGGGDHDVAHENLQPRIRGNILMALANKHGFMPLCTGNRSESLAGYTTLYGDTVGGYAPISDVPKTLVYKLAERINARAERELIPRRIIDKEPTAELKPGQKDADALGPYDTLDAIMEAYLDEGKPYEQLIAYFGEQAVQNALSRYYLSEFKRCQSPPGPRLVSSKLHTENKLPIINSFKAWFSRTLW